MTPLVKRCNAFALSGREDRNVIYPGCYPGLCAFALSGREDRNVIYPGCYPGLCASALSGREGAGKAVVSLYDAGRKTTRS